MRYLFNLLIFLYIAYQVCKFIIRIQSADRNRPKTPIKPGRPRSQPKYPGGQQTYDYSHPVKKKQSGRTALGLRWGRLSPNFFEDRLKALTRTESIDLDIIVSGADSQGRYRGAYVYLTKSEAARRRQLIKDGITERDANIRKQALTPGFDHVKNQGVEINGTWFSHYHRTHCVAFRHSLDEGMVDGLLFTGSSYLNSGDRPSHGYVVTNRGSSDSHDARVETLKEMFFEAQRQRKPLTGYALSIETDNRTLPSAQFSLDDFERLYDFMLNYRSESVIRYGVMLHYRNGGLIPSEAEVVIVDVTKRHKLVDVVLQNLI